MGHTAVSDTESSSIRDPINLAKRSIEKYYNRTVDAKTDINQIGT